LFPALIAVLGLYGVVTGQTESPVSAATTNAWSALTGSQSSFHRINAIAVNGSDVYIGGEFTDLNGDAGRDYLAKWNGTPWSNVG